MDSLPQQHERFHGWHLDKKVPISIIVVLLMQAASGLWMIASMRRDIDVLAVQVRDQGERDKRQDEALGQAVSLIRSDLKGVADKLDRLIERSQK